MKIYETKVVPARESTYVKYKKCDLCGLKTDGDDWDTGLWEVNETIIRIEIEQKDGDNYPEGGSGTEYEIDLCPECFKNKLVPWLNSQGANVQQKEWSW